MADLPNDADGQGADRCGGCRWWQSDQNATGDEDHIGLCLHEELAHFQLQVSGDSGCNRFEPAVLAVGTRSPSVLAGPLTVGTGPITTAAGSGSGPAVGVFPPYRADLPVAAGRRMA